MNMEVFNCFGHMFRHTHIIWLVVSNMNGLFSIPSGELTFCHGKSPFCSWENPLFLWPFSIAMLVHQRVTIIFNHQPDDYPYHYIYICHRKGMSSPFNAPVHPTAGRMAAQIPLLRAALWHPCRARQCCWCPQPTGAVGGTPQNHGESHRKMEKTMVYSWEKHRKTIGFNGCLPCLIHFIRLMSTPD